MMNGAFLAVEASTNMDLTMVVWYIASIVVHAAFAVAVFTDAKDLVEHGKETTFVGPIIWTLATLLGGVVVAAVYWFMHHSAFAREPE